MGAPAGCRGGGHAPAGRWGGGAPERGAGEVDVSTLRGGRVLGVDVSTLRCGRVQPQGWTCPPLANTYIPSVYIYLYIYIYIYIYIHNLYIYIYKYTYIYI